MKYFYIGFFTFFFSILPILAQEGETIIATVNDKPVYLSALETAYKKNNLDNTSDKNDLKDFFEKYILFKLNVEEAYAQQLDTIENYRYQYDIFRSSLIRPYLAENAFQQEYIARIYERMSEDINLNHVFIPFETKSEIVFAADTLKAYKKAMEIRKALLSSGFNNKKYVDNANNPNIVPDLNRINGHLGWITPFMLNQQTMKSAYNLPLNEISMPIKSSSGYHIIQVLQKRPAIGSRIVEQVVFRYPSMSPNKRQMDSVFQTVKHLRKSINTDHDFQALCNAYAEVYELGERGCSLDETSLDSKLPPSFISVAFSLKKVGEISKPVASMFGVHLLRLKEMKPLEPLDSVKDKLMSQITRSDYSFYFSTDFQEYLFNKYDFQLNKQSYEKLTDIAGEITPNSPDFITQVSNKNDILFTIEDSAQHTVEEFVKYLETKSQSEGSSEKAQLDQLFGQNAQNPYNFSVDRLKYHLDQYAAQQLFNHVSATMEKRQPSVKWKLQEFSDGLLVYNVKEKNIWNRSLIKDTYLETYYNQNKSKYKWSSPHYKGYIIYCTDKDTKEKINTFLKTIKPTDDLPSLLQKEFGEKLDNKTKINAGIWEKGRNPHVDKKAFKTAGDVTPDAKYPEVVVVGRLMRSPETYQDVRGEVEADYQQEKEIQWNNYLRNKYKVAINQSVLNNISI